MRGGGSGGATIDVPPWLEAVEDVGLVGVVVDFVGVLLCGEPHGTEFLAVAWWPVNSIFLAPVEQWFPLWESARRPSVTLGRARDGWLEVPLSHIVVRPFGSAFWRAVGTLARPDAE